MWSLGGGQCGDVVEGNVVMCWRTMSCAGGQYGHVMDVVKGNVVICWMWWRAMWSCPLMWWRAMQSYSGCGGGQCGHMLDVVKGNVVMCYDVVESNAVICWMHDGITNQPTNKQTNIDSGNGCPLLRMNNNIKNEYN